jgi:hypothetical protein
LAWIPVVAWVQAAAMAKRLHDVGLSGWWVPVIYFGSLVPAIVGLRAGTLLMLGAVVGLALTPGEPHANAYGTPSGPLPKPEVDHPSPEKAGIGGALLWPAAGLIVSFALLILQLRIEDIVALPNRFRFIITFQWLGSFGMRDLAIFLLPVVDLIHLLALIGTPVIIVNFFTRSRHTKRLIQLWLCAGILLTAIPIIDASAEVAGAAFSLFYFRSDIGLFPTDGAAQAVLALAGPSVLLIPVVSISLSLPQFAVLVGWLVYFRHSRRVANTFTRELTLSGFRVRGSVLIGAGAGLALLGMLLGIPYIVLSTVLFQETDGRAIIGTSIKGAPHYANTFVCRASCLTNPVCVAFEVQKRQSMCTLFSKIDEMPANSFYYSGIRRR